MTKNQNLPHIRGMKLIQAVLERADDLGIDSVELAEKLGYTEPYWKAFVRGSRWIGAVGTDKLQLIADFLQKPLLTIYILAEILDANSFIYKESLEKVFSDTYKRLIEHEALRIFAPDEKSWRETPEATKLLCVYLVARLMNEELIDLAKEGLIRRPLL
jgi:hypothetical protein